MRRATLTGFVLVLMAAFALPARADELSDFESARREYEHQSYGKAARELESLVGGAVPRARNPVVRLEARKYLGAAYLFLDQPDAAREQFRLLLEEDPEYDLDPVAFPEAVVQTFEEVQSQVKAELARKQAQEAAQEQQQRAEELEALIQEQRRLQMLEELAATETVEKVNSRWIAALPFGIGQFQNEDRGLGIMFATTQSAFLAATIATFIGHNSLRDENPAPDEIDRARRVERALRIGNWASAGAFVGFALAGIIEAEVRFKPVIRSTRQRELPEGLGSLEGTRPEIRLELGVTGGGLRLDF
ncbi:MAG: hypothetical protein AMS21_00610 [Gemmatimonas sp. SG8_38_2]|nr:MAG: hypothetical protein AMS21_00610 [Gemmatimonas sp. SG8_38_2]